MLKTGVSINGALVPKWWGFLQILLSDHTRGFPADSNNGFTVWLLLFFSVWLWQFCHGEILLTDANAGQKRSSKWDAYEFCRTASYSNFLGSCLQFPDWLFDFRPAVLTVSPLASQRDVFASNSRSPSALCSIPWTGGVAGALSGKAHSSLTCKLLF